MAKMFSDQCGSIVCRELLNLGKDLEGPAPTPRTEQFYKKRPCGEYVQLAADITQKIIFEEERLDFYFLDKMQINDQQQLLDNIVKELDIEKHLT